MNEPTFGEAMDRVSIKLIDAVDYILEREIVLKCEGLGYEVLKIGSKWSVTFGGTRLGELDVPAKIAALNGMPEFSKQYDEYYAKMYKAALKAGGFIHE